LDPIRDGLGQGIATAPHLNDTVIRAMVRHTDAPTRQETQMQQTQTLCIRPLDRRQDRGRTLRELPKGLRRLFNRRLDGAMGLDHGNH
jgi:hypothetical protein